MKIRSALLLVVSAGILSSLPAFAASFTQGSTACGVNGAAGPTKISANQGIVDILIVNTSTTPAFIGNGSVTPATAPCIGATNCASKSVSFTGLSNTKDLSCVGNSAVTVYWVGRVL